MTEPDGRRPRDGKEHGDIPDALSPPPLGPRPARSSMLVAALLALAALVVVVLVLLLR